MEKREPTSFAGIHASDFAVVSCSYHMAKRMATIVLQTAEIGQSGANQRSTSTVADIKIF